MSFPNIQDIMSIATQTQIQNLNCCIRSVSLDNFFHTKKFFYLCYIQLLFSIFLITSQVVEFLLPFYVFDGPIYECYVIFCGLVMGVSGTVGLWTSHNTSGPRIKVFLIFAIMTAYFSVSLIAYSIILFILITNLNICEWDHHYFRFTDTYELFSPDDSLCIYVNHDYFPEHPYVISYVVLTLIATIGVIEVGVSSTMSMVLCKSFWNSKKRSYEHMSIKDNPSISTSLAKRRRIIWMSLIQIIVSSLSLSINMTWCITFCDLEDSIHGKLCGCDEKAYIGVVLVAVVAYALCGINGIVTGLFPTKYFCISLTSLVIISTCSYIFYLVHKFSELGESLFIITNISNIPLILVQAVIGVIQMIFSAKTSMFACKSVCNVVFSPEEKQKSSVASIQILNDHHIIQTRELSLRLNNMM